jgi:hypothetical protein
VKISLPTCASASRTTLDRLPPFHARPSHKHAERFRPRFEGQVLVPNDPNHAITDATRMPQRAQIHKIAFE